MDNALIIFARNLEKGKVKNRLAESIGDDKALEVYKYLLGYTKDVTICCKCSLFVFYSDYIHINDVFNDDKFSKHLQEGNDLGERMANAFIKVFDLGCKNVCIIGSDCYDLQTDVFEQSFENLQKTEIVIGATTDGGYYLLGMKTLYPDLFKNKEWGTSSVSDDTFETIKTLGLTYTELNVLNDIDTIEDLLETDILTKLEEEIQ